MDDPIARFAHWLADAAATEPNDPNACALASIGVDAGGAFPDVRMVLLKGHDARGFVIYTNLESVKGGQLLAIPRAALCFHWKTQRRQVRIRGPVDRVIDTEADAYFATRPRQSQLSAWASHQSRPLDARASFEARLKEMAVRFPEGVPRPPHWSGLRLRPERIEFWEDREGRQHHREVAEVRDGGWTWGLLYP
jgi:pyridoxamine 5'-phosphate oxidase